MSFNVQQKSMYNFVFFSNILTAIKPLAVSRQQGGWGGGYKTAIQKMGGW